MSKLKNMWLKLKMMSSAYVLEGDQVTAQCRSTIATQVSHVVPCGQRAQVGITWAGKTKSHSCMDAVVPIVSLV